jgi:hypothetical protein
LKLVDDTTGDIEDGTLTVEILATHTLPRVNLDSSRVFKLDLDVAVDLEYAFDETEVE